MIFLDGKKRSGALDSILAEPAHITIKNNAALTGIKRLSSNGIGRLSTIAAKRARGIPIHPTNRQDGRDKRMNAEDPSMVLYRLYGI